MEWKGKEGVKAGGGGGQEEMKGTRRRKSGSTSHDLREERG